ncbi:HK97-gp10 family putative phage morphogenesis protein [Streptococcus gallolyticus]|jgi:HK97 gp10 family phage protein|uniref:HK97-gp10 family putative phage morphogenesis protein n=1 Tax=Streptococcus gallolyticus TaxID=315405 RepID=UPI000E4294E9|nr:HK97-gp10 family putative phage morphogenesis protein [Streptococcus gallolyticus]MCO4605164.1 phage protein, HK97 gp10 family [Streptococcus infantarius subsp. infantarius]MCO4638359.1 phage protein, HK97 gp10 family [Streptococcus infantarius subsp. infantarius]MCO4641655.1 phage protein, HK97 gp10 family [Streptococcus infantarius subsp. infantarius]MCO4643454.1 phage protein, HK97 gp10 family [Streptococcus infantarius subsp. infantarius]RGC36650.1 HK97 gp10 family phage protein [Strept
MTSVSFKGDKELLSALEKMARTDVYKEVVKKSGADLQKKAKEKAVFTKGYSTGATKRSIDLQIENGGLSARVTAKTDYSGYLEVGTRKMEAQPFMQPAFNEVQPKFIDDLRRAGIVK